jgi:hypothetical protein
MKTTTIELPAEIYKRLLAKYSQNKSLSKLLPHNLSVESKFDCYYTHPHRVLICDDATGMIAKWQNHYDGDRLSATLLSLFDCKSLSESFRGNRKEKNNLQSQDRVTPDTCTNMVLGSTFLTCQFQESALRNGLQRRFLYYLSEGTARDLDRPKPNEAMIESLVKNFSLLTQIQGQFEWDTETGKAFDEYCHEKKAEIKACDVLDETKRSILTSARALVAKIAMQFQCAILCYFYDSNKGFPKLVIGNEALDLAKRHVDACLQAVIGLDSVCNRPKIAEAARHLLSRIYGRYHYKAKGDSILLTKSEITIVAAPRLDRFGDSKTYDIYAQQIPYLIRTGLAKVFEKQGKKTVYAFRLE